MPPRSGNWRKILHQPAEVNIAISKPTNASARSFVVYDTQKIPCEIPAAKRKIQVVPYFSNAVNWQLTRPEAPMRSTATSTGETGRAIADAFPQPAPADIGSYRYPRPRHHIDNIELVINYDVPYDGRITCIVSVVPPVRRPMVAIYIRQPAEQRSSGY